MADTTNISWCRSTHNPWIGCTKVGNGCTHCYAEALDKRHKWGGTTHWGPGVPRYRTSASNWAKPLQWNRQATKEREAGIRWAPDMPPGFWPVFCASLADVFDNEVPQEWRNDLWRLIEQTPHLSWLLVTKRIGNVQKMVPTSWAHKNPLFKTHWPDNCRLMITVVNQEEADRDIPKLLALPCKNGISYEPALGPVDWSRYLCPWNHTENRYGHRLDWIIVGGESNQGQHKARPFDVGWARETARQCKDAGVACFFKQAGSNPILDGQPLKLRDRAGGDLSEIPEDIRVRDFPNA